MTWPGSLEVGAGEGLGADGVQDGDGEQGRADAVADDVDAGRRRRALSSKVW